MGSTGWRRVVVVALNALLIMGATVSATATERLQGDSRYGTAVAISAVAFPEGASRVFVARGDTFPDALSAGSLTGGPILLVPRRGPVPDVVRTEVERLDPEEVIGLGGPTALPDEVLEAVADGRSTQRLAGDDRFATSAAISRFAFPDGSDVVYLARSDSFPDALAAGALTQGPVLLVPSSGALPEPIRSAISSLDPARVVALGGSSALSEEVLAAAGLGRDTDRLAGRTRYETAIAIGREAFPNGASRVFLTRGDAFPDALAAGALDGGPLLLAPPCGDLPAEVGRELTRWAATVVPLGGPQALCPSIVEAADLASAPWETVQDVVATDGGFEQVEATDEGLLLIASQRLYRSTDGRNSEPILEGELFVVPLGSSTGDLHVEQDGAVHRVTWSGLERLGDIPDDANVLRSAHRVGGTLLVGGTSSETSSATRNEAPTIWTITPTGTERMQLQSTYDADVRFIASTPSGAVVAMGREYLDDGSVFVQVWNDDGDQVLPEALTTREGFLVDATVDAGGTMWMAVSRRDGDEIWSSDDGRTWRIDRRPFTNSVPVPTDGTVTAQISRVTSLDGRVVATGWLDVRRGCDREDEFGPICDVAGAVPMLWYQEQGAWIGTRLGDLAPQYGEFLDGIARLPNGTLVGVGAAAGLSADGSGDAVPIFLQQRSRTLPVTREDRVSLDEFGLAGVWFRHDADVAARHVSRRLGAGDIEPWSHFTPLNDGSGMYGVDEEPTGPRSLFPFSRRRCWQDGLLCAVEGGYSLDQTFLTGWTSRGVGTPSLAPIISPSGVGIGSTWGEIRTAYPDASASPGEGGALRVQVPGWEGIFDGVGQWRLAGSQNPGDRTPVDDAEPLTYVSAGEGVEPGCC